MTNSGSQIRVEIVVAVGSNGVIGNEGAMPWHLSTDLKRFKAITMGRPVVMGRRTYQSIGRALPGRTNIVVTRNARFQAPGVKVADSVEQALSMARRQAAADDIDSVCVLGGGQIYAQVMPIADRMHVTHVEAAPKGDTCFPGIDRSDWEIESEQVYPEGPKDSAATRYVIYRRKQESGEKA